jgi:hypothetical protein
MSEKSSTFDYTWAKITIKQAREHAVNKPCHGNTHPTKLVDGKVYPDKIAFL